MDYVDSQFTDIDAANVLLLLAQNARHRNEYIASETSSSTSIKEETDEEVVEPMRSFVRVRSDSSDKMVPIGSGYAIVPSRVLRDIDWNSHTQVTRRLMKHVFSRRVLATHSLTGKRSPAFPGKPAKKKLDPKLVSDVIHIVTEKCGVPERLVKNVITLKCADECKMLRMRMNMRSQEREDSD